jgi:hypothetical protein
MDQLFPAADDDPETRERLKLLHMQLRVERVTRAALAADGSAETRELALRADAMLALLSGLRPPSSVDYATTKAGTEQILNTALARLAEIAQGQPA